MATETNNSTSGGIGFYGLLLIAFVVLELTDVIAWSWRWARAPAWISNGLVSWSLQPSSAVPSSVTNTYTNREAASALGISYHAAVKRLKRAGPTPPKTLGPSKVWTMKQIESLKPWALENLPTSDAPTAFS